MAYYIYQRISTEKQSLVRQEGAIGDYCRSNNIEVPTENIFSDVITGKTIKRENYQAMKSILKKDDVLIMLDLDRLGRKWDIIKDEWRELTSKGVYIIIVNCPLINVLPDKNGEISIDKRLIQEMMFTLLCYVSQKEVEKVSLRTKEALKAKKEQGVKIGAPRKCDDEMIEEIKELRSMGFTCQMIADKMGVSKTTISRMARGLK